MADFSSPTTKRGAPHKVLRTWKESNPAGVPAGLEKLVSGVLFALRPGERSTSTPFPEA